MFMLIMLKPALNSTLAQLDPTQQQQTINAIINPRLTLTAAPLNIGSPPPSSTSSGSPTRTNTTVSSAVPASPVPPTATPTQSLTPSQVGPTDLARTVIAAVQQRLTLT